MLGLLVALGRMGPSRLLRYALNAYVEIFRDVPLIVQLLVIYFSLPSIGITLPAFWAGVLGLSLNLAAYMSEMFRASILSIDPGQREAGLSIGMSQATSIAASSCPRRSGWRCPPWAATSSPCSRTARSFPSSPSTSSCGEIAESGTAQALFDRPQSPALKQFMDSIRR